MPYLTIEDAKSKLDRGKSLLDLTLDVSQCQSQTITRLIDRCDSLARNYAQQWV